MCRNAVLTPFTLALLLLACGRSDTVDDNVVSLPDEMAGDMSATGLAAPANAAAAEAAVQAALPAGSRELGWSYRSIDRMAEFGPPGTPAFSIQCLVQREGQKQLVFVRFAAQSAGSQATLSFTGNGQIASVPIAAVVNPGGTGGHWRAAIAPGDTARHVAKTFGGSGTVEVSLSGHSPLIVTTTAAPRRVFADCAGG